MEIICKICGEKFTHTKDAYCIRAMCEHLRTKHNLSKEQYLIQYLRNGIVPTCECGCGMPVKVAKGWDVFKRFYADSHVKLSIRQRAKATENIRKKVKSKEYILMKYDENTLKQALESYKFHLKTITELSEELSIDSRTLKKAWLDLNWTNLNELEIIAQYNQLTKSKQTKIENFASLSNSYQELYNIAKNKPQTYSINTLISEYNDLHPDNIIVLNRRTVLNKLYELYGEEIISLLLYGYHSKSELEFLNVLQFYFGKSKVKNGFKIERIRSKKEKDYIYDFCINNKLIIEYDGEFYHSDNEQKEFDKAKTQFAINKGYIVLRVSEKNAKNIDTLIKIRDLVNDTNCKG